MRTLVAFALILALLVGAGLFVTRPQAVAEAEVAALTPDVVRGEAVFHAAGCASCHAAPEAEGEERLVLAGGKAFATFAGTFHAPNISQDPEAGIGSWSRAEIVSAIMEGTSPDGRHYYPAFPYGSYARAELGDIVSLAAYLETLPADATPSKPHELGFPWSLRVAIGGWKLLNASPAWVLELPVADQQLERGRYLAEALGHCGECHTARTMTQGLDRAAWLAGAPNPSGRGRIPNITPDKLDWSEADIVAYLETGFTPEFDVAGGSMADVVTSLSHLPKEDLEAIAAYLKAVPSVN